MKDEPIAYLDQSEEQRARDAARQSELRGQALGSDLARALRPLAEIEREITEASKALLATPADSGERTALEDRLLALQAERDAQAELRKAARARVAGKDATTLDFIERSITDTERQYDALFATDDEARAQLGARLVFLRGERDRILGLTPDT